ncbi:alpha/beta hydrolase [Caenispirillum salinarum]|uniref:alpha/beta hydrolase n=1 Tax=Caenispirillum salinarum TaxID=859058 RepID=UPI0038501870
MATVHFATNRSYTTGPDGTITFGARFHHDGPEFIRFGSADVVRKPDGTYDCQGYRVEPESAQTNRLGSTAVFDQLRKAMREGCTDTLCLIHGYACGFKTALERAGELQDKYAFDGKPLNMFVFSWPSDGTTEFQAYGRDRIDASMSGVAMARAFLKLRRYLMALPEQTGQPPDGFCNQRIHLVAHSMGNYALRHALRSVRKELEGAPLPRLLDTVFLMAADEDEDAFEHDTKLGLLPEICRQVLVYYSENDRALTISDVTKGNVDRLGTTGPRVLTGLPRKVKLVDCSEVDWTRLTHGRHQYYRLRDEVVTDVRAVLAGVRAEDMAWRRRAPNERAWRIMPGGAGPATRDEPRLRRDQLELA